MPVRAIWQLTKCIFQDLKMKIADTKYIIPLNSSAYFIDSQKCQSEEGEDNGNS
jgi:hypothetical protein